MEGEKVTLQQRASDAVAAAANKAAEARKTTEDRMRMVVAQLEASASKVCATFVCVFEEILGIP